LERLNGSNATPARKGLLLADDVGLGKTTVAALVAWVVARAGNGRVRILAPNKVMARRWASELELHVPLLRACARRLAVEGRHIKRSESYALKQGQIQVATHSRATSGEPLDCDLLIVDEAHRAKGENSKFAQALRRRTRRVKRILILTATPFSIHIRELERLLRLVGGEASVASVRAYDAVLDHVYRRARLHAAEDIAQRLAERARAAVWAIKPYVIRHAVDDLKSEMPALGKFHEIGVPVEPASSEVVEVLIRADRVLQLARDRDHRLGARTNDPRFHVGWDQLKADLTRIGQQVDVSRHSGGGPLKKHLLAAKAVLSQQREHPKVRDVAQWVERRVRSGEKVVVFCHHHATAREIAIAIQQRLRGRGKAAGPRLANWWEAWAQVLDHELARIDSDSVEDDRGLRDAYVGWLCSPLLRSQVERWHGRSLGNDVPQIAAQLKRTRARRVGKKTIAVEAAELYRRLTQRESRSTVGVLRSAGDDPSRIPGGGPEACAVQALCDYRDDCEPETEPLFRHNNQPDAVLAIFNSPFGPEVLVATDRLSEGIDLHGYCRTIVHYELDPSPIRTIQRNGRLRRINGWSTQIGKPIECAYPAFGGTRDERLVEIMRGRLAAFSLLLGGAADIKLEDDGWDDPDDENWRRGVLDRARAQLKSLPRQLVVRRRT
jgi:superfamily II DNA or RNA helicase